MINITESFFQVFLASIGSIGFAAALNAKRERIPIMGSGGGLSWGIHLLSFFITDSIFTSSIISSSFAYLYSAVFSKIQKAPINVFFAPTIIPMLPGGGLYYTVYSLIEENKKNFYSFGKETLHTSLGLVIGYIFCSVVWNLIISLHKKTHIKPFRKPSK